MTTVAIIVAAGRGSRLGGPVPKQYLPLAGKALLEHAIDAFTGHPAVDAVQVAIHPDDAALYQAVIGQRRLLPPVAGGATRQETVRLALERLAAAPPDRVLVHDGARPLVSAALIQRTLAALETAPGAIAAVPLADTLKSSGSGLAQAGPPRDGLWRAQTPQAFRYAEIRAAHRAAQGLALTDDAAVAEHAGLAVALVAGEEDNLKVTDGLDLKRAERLLAQRLGDVRTGFGFDVHGFAERPRPLLLCGVAVPHPRGLAGHSDADVALHALTDAVLGALADGDIGEHFPPSEPAWKDAASDRFLRHAADLVAARGGMIAHVDLTLVCERPRIGPHRAAMRARVADILRLQLDRVSVKATTTEGLGFTGRGEGIAAQAIATIRLP